jgi:hypothetical protein
LPPRNRVGLLHAHERGRGFTADPGRSLACQHHVLRGHVQLVTGLDNRLRWLTGKKTAFRLADGAAPLVLLDRSEGDYESDCDWQLDHASRRTAGVRHAFFGH